jgi:hypothetical protein
MRVRPELSDILATGIQYNGSPLASGKVYTYDAGTTTPKFLYQNYNLSSSHTNPIFLNAQGRAAAYGVGSYKFVVKDSGDNTLFTYDNVQLGTESDHYAGATTGSSNAYTATGTQSNWTLTAGFQITIIPNHTNTGAATLTAYGVTKDIKRTDGTDPLAGQIATNIEARLLYDGTNWVLLNPASVYSAWTPAGLYGGGTLASLTWDTVTERHYAIEGDLCHVYLNIIVGYGSGTGNTIIFECPVTPALTGDVFNAGLLQNGSFYHGWVQVYTDGKFYISKEDLSNFAAAPSQVSFRGTVSYPI